MEHFSVVQSIIRAGLAGDQEAFDKQVARLRERLRKAGQDKEADTIERLLRAATETKDIKPSRVELSRAQVTGETLRPDVHPPIDRETGAQLCTISFPRDVAGDVPVFGAMVTDTIEGILSEWSNAAELQGVGVAPTRSLLIFGPPGAGKTMTATHIARRLGLPLVTARIDGLISSFLGTTARNIANLFEFANRYACVLLLDEFDALAKLRDDPQEIGEIKRVVNTLLQNLDARREIGVTIAITNHDRLLDPAVWRRFEAQLQIREPDRPSREALIRRFMLPIEVSEPLARVFAYCLDGRSGADVQRVCDAVKRTVALGGHGKDSPALFRALSAVMARVPVHDSRPAQLLARDLDWFISYAANDPELELTQTQIGEVTGVGQSRVSTLKKSKPYLSEREQVDA